MYIHNLSQRNWCTKKELSDCNEISCAKIFAQTCNWLKFGVQLMNNKSSNAELCIQQVYIRSNSQSDIQNFCISVHFHCRYLMWTVTKPHRRIFAHYEHISQFRKGCVIELKEAEWPNQRVIRHLNRRYAAIRWRWQEWVNNNTLSVRK